MKYCIALVLVIAITGCVSSHPRDVSTIDFGGGTILEFSGPDRELVIHDVWGQQPGATTATTNYHLSIIVDDGAVSYVYLSPLAYINGLTPELWNRRNKAMVRIDGVLHLLVETWRELSKHDHRFSVLEHSEARLGDGRLALAATSKSEQEFYLRDNIGDLYGPFVRPKGADSLYLEHEYAVVRPLKREKGIIASLTNVIIGKISWTNESIENAVSFLNTQHKALSESTYLPIVLDLLDYTRPDVDVGSFIFLVDETEWVKAIQRKCTPPPITFTCHSINLLEAIRITCISTYLQYSIGKDSVVLSQKRIPTN